MLEDVQIEELYKEMAQSIIDGEAEQAVALAQKSIELQMHPLDTITKGFVVGVNYIGDQFGKGEAFLPELVMAGEAMKAAVATLEPELLKLGEAREVMRDRAAEMAVDRDDAVRPALERRAVHARLVVEALDERVGAQLDEVAPAGLVLGEQHQVEAAVGDAERLFVAPIARREQLAAGARHAVGRDVGFDAEDRLDPRLLAGDVELDGAEQVPVVGERDRVHVERVHALDQLGHAIAAVEERILRVEMQVDETGRGGRREQPRCYQPRRSAAAAEVSLEAAR